MRAFLDSSAFAKRFIDEPGSDAVRTICARATMLGLSVLCVPEIISALNRRRREHRLGPKDYREVRRRVLADVEDAEIVQLTPEVIGSAIGILEAGPIRTLDAIQVAAALEWKADLFVSADLRQLAAARRAGLKMKRT